MEELTQAIEAGDYPRAFTALGRSDQANTPVGLASGAFLLALQARFDEAEELLARTQAPAIAAIVRGERERCARWGDPRVAGQLAASVPLPFLGVYAGMALALLQGDEALVARIKADMATQVKPVAGTLHLTAGHTRAFTDLADADDPIGQMLEVYVGSGLLYFPFAALRRIDFLPPKNFIDMLVRKVQLTDRQGRASQGFCPLLYAYSSTAPDSLIRNGRTTMFEYVGAGRRGSGQRDFCLDGSTMVGMERTTAIELAA